MYHGSELDEAVATNNYQTYGVLYNYPSALNACPEGWHLPTDEEWSTLSDYLGGEEIAGGKLKEKLTIHWNYPNEGTTNETGFTALPGGKRIYNGKFNLIGNYGNWWSATEKNTNLSWCRYMDYRISYMERSSSSLDEGHSVRCIKDD